MENNNTNKIINIVPYIFIGAIVIVSLFAFNIIPTSSNKTNEISFTEKNIRLQKNQGIQLTINGSNNNIKYKSSNSNIATVNEYTGYVTAINNGTVTITAYLDSNNSIYDECTIEVYSGSSNTIEVTSVELSNNSLSMYVGDSKKLSAIVLPSNASNRSIYWSTSDSSIATVDNNGNVVAKSVGVVLINAKASNGVYATCNVTVSNKGSVPVPTPSVKPQIEKLVISSNKLSVKLNETKKIDYHIEPSNGEIKSINWSSSNTSIITVDSNGNVTGKKIGSAEVTLNINGNLIGKVTVTVNPKITGLNLKSSSSLSLKVGNTSQISVDTIPSNSGVNITYSSNSNHVTVSSTGLIKAVSSGTAVITVKADGYTKTINVTVSSSSSSSEPTVTTGGVWGYSDSNTVKPTRAGTSFFTNLANNGVGTISGNVYKYSGYTYDISKSNLTYNGRTSLIRIYYPNGKDLSNVNTLAFLGGTSERNMSGMFSAIDKDTSMIKSGGIIILVSTTGSYNYQDAINATNFVKAITKQKSGKKNSVAGYSLGGPAAGKAMINGNYNRLFILHSKVELSDTAKLKNKTVYVYSPKGDKLSDSTRTTLVSFKNDGAGKNITVVTNNSEFIKTFGSVFTIVNPGSAQGSGHGYANFVNGNVFAFACKD